MLRCIPFVGCTNTLLVERHLFGPTVVRVGNGLRGRGICGGIVGHVATLLPNTQYVNAESGAPFIRLGLARLPTRRTYMLRLPSGAVLASWLR